MHDTIANAFGTLGDDASTAELGDMIDNVIAFRRVLSERTAVLYGRESWLLFRVARRIDFNLPPELWESDP